MFKVAPKACGKRDFWCKAEIVDKLVGFGNKAIFGIIDWDVKNSRNDNVKTLGLGKRYSIENYVFDPILISALLLREKWIQREDIGLDGNRTYTDFKYLTNEQLQKISDFLTSEVNLLDPQSNTTRSKIRYVRGFEIELPNWYLLHQGHDLENKLKKRFPQLLRYRNEGDLKKEVLNKVIDDIPEFIPSDIYDLFLSIQSA